MFCWLYLSQCFQSGIVNTLQLLYIQLCPIPRSLKLSLTYRTGTKHLVSSTLSSWCQAIARVSYIAVSNLAWRLQLFLVIATPEHVYKVNRICMLLNQLFDYKFCIKFYDGSYVCKGLRNCEQMSISSLRSRPVYLIRLFRYIVYSVHPKRDVYACYGRKHVCQ